MSHKKIILIEIFLLGAPIFLAFLNGAYSNLKSFRWGYDHINEVTNICLSIGLVSNAYIFYYLNKYSQYQAWRVFNIFIIVLLVILMYIGNSLSHLGF